MSFPVFEHLSNKRIILASTSPRRIELFNRMGLDYEMIASGFEENLDKSQFSTPAEYSAATCAGKGQAVLVDLLSKSEEKKPSVIVSSDTIVVCGKNIYEKPIDRADAKRMLMELSNQRIQVITAVMIIYQSANGSFKNVSFDEITEMVMVEMSEALIDSYISRGEGMDHSGALSYQGGAFLLVKSIHGCFYNLIGFPASRFYQELAKIQDLIF